MNLLNILCDPISKQDLQKDDNFLYAGDRSYPIVNNIPVMLTDKEHQAKEAEKLKRKKYQTGFSWALKHWEDLRVNTLLGQAPEGKTSLLNFGSGSPKEKIKMESQGYKVTSIDINAGYEGVDIIGDGHYLPLKDKTFDTITSFEVLEHLHEPWTAIKEINRVLKDDGRFVGSVAFLKEFHESYFHMSYWGVKKLLEYGGFELEDIYGGQNIFSRLVHKVFPLGPSGLSQKIYDGLGGSIMKFRKWYWARKNKGDYTQKLNKFDKNVPFSFEEYDQVVYAPTVLFSAKKVRNV